ncbi:MAG: hypothetical protein E7Z75_09855 [Methanobrevibacter olleyae]|uniref:Adhesin-like protein n=1 Tax=Methanobrevibacter olleyae TaxID=294671 RepID=A0A8T3VQH6_METOL|nr:hypothetical protein [Methanobrevibacter olleyae]
MKNKKILFTLLLLTVILSINLVSATDIDNNQTADSITQESTMQETNEIQNDIRTDTKEITKKTDATVKESDATVKDVNELKSAIDQAKTSTKNEYTITLDKQFKSENTGYINWNVKNKTLIINGNNQTLNITSISVSSNLILNNLTITNPNREYYSDEIIYNSGHLNINNCILSNMKYDDMDGYYVCIMITNKGYLNIEKSQIINNSMGLISNYGTLEIIKSEIYNNRDWANDLIYNLYHSNITITNSKIENNTNVICNDNSNLKITQSTLNNNRGWTLIDNTKGNVTITQSTFNNNQATWGNGGAIYNFEANLTVKNSTFNNNQAKLGGAIYNRLGNLNIINSTFINNKAEEGNDIYNFTNETKIFLSPLNNNEYRNYITINGSLRQINNQKILSTNKLYLLVNNEKIKLNTTNNGDFSTTIKLNTTGIWTVKAIFEGNYGYLPCNTSTTFNVTKRKTTINANITDSFSEDYIIIKGSLTDKTNTKLGNTKIYINVNNQQYQVLSDENGIFTLNYTSPIKGTNNITVLYKGSKNYEASNATTTFDYDDTKILINSTYYRENITIKALIKIGNKTLKNTNVNLTINNETTTIKTDKNGMINYTCLSKKAGNNTLKITYKNKTWTRNFTTQKRNTILTNTKITETTSGNLIITGTLKDKTGTKLKNANIYVTINGKTEHTLTDNKATYQINHNNTQKEKYDITIQYKGNKNYDPTNLTTTYDINISQSTYSYYTYYIYATLKENKILKNKYVNLTINNETTNKKTNENGFLAHNHYSKKAGTNTLEITYNDIKWIQNFITPKINTTITITKITETTPGKFNITGQLNDIPGRKLNNSKIYITVNGKTKQTLTDNNGIYQSNYTAPKNGTYTITVEFKGNNDYNPSTNKTTIIIPQSTTINIKNYNELVKQINKIQQGTQKEYTINLKPGNYNATANITLESTYGIKYKVIINGNNITLDGQNKYRFMKISDCTLDLRNITLKNYQSVYDEGSDGAINLKSGKLNVINSTFTENKGGAIHSYGNCNIINSTFSYNWGFNGGAIDGKANILNSIFSNNIAAGGYGEWVYGNYGGALSGLFNITDSILVNNRANFGGAIAGSGNITNSILKNNTAGLGGAIFLEYSYLNIVNSNLTNNTAYGGGAIFSYCGEYTIINSQFTNNTASNDMIGDASINDMSYADHMKTSSGGAIYNYRSVLYDSNSIFKSNKAKEGNNIYNENSTYIAAKATEITVQPISQVKADEKATITGKLTDENNNPIKNTNIEITINGKLYGDSQYTNITKINVKTNDKGIYNYTYIPNSGGNYTITVNFPGNQNYKTNKTETTLNVNPIGTKVTVNPITNAKVNQKISITGKLTDENNNPLRLTSVGIIIDNNKIYVKTDENGIYSYAYTPTSVGTKNIKIYYGGYHKYAYSLTTLSLNVKA